MIFIDICIKLNEKIYILSVYTIAKSVVSYKIAECGGVMRNVSSVCVSVGIAILLTSHKTIKTNTNR
jgi:hypothetical protein